MAEITDEVMRQLMTTSRNYSLVILKAGPNRWADGAAQTVWEHGRRNFALRAEGLLSIICPVTDDGDVRGVGIFNAPIEEVKVIMDADPGVKTGVFVYEVHPCRSFPGDCLPS